MIGIDIWMRFGEAMALVGKPGGHMYYPEGIDGVVSMNSHPRGITGWNDPSIEVIDGVARNDAIAEVMTAASVDRFLRTRKEICLEGKSDGTCEA